MKPLLLVLALALALVACGATRPELVMRRGGFLADAYGFACECGQQTFEVLGRTFVHVRLRCPKCHRDWYVTAL